MKPKKFALPALEMQRARVEEMALSAFIHAAKYELVDGDVRETKVGKCYPIPEQKVYAEEIVRFLNGELQEKPGHTWRAVWTNPKKSYYDRLSGLFRPWVPQSLELQYIDTDGDVQFVVDLCLDAATRNMDVFTLLENYSFTDVMQLCHGAYKEYYDLMAAAELRVGHMFSPKKGERDTAHEEFSVNNLI